MLSFINAFCLTQTQVRAHVLILLVLQTQNMEQEAPLRVKLVILNTNEQTKDSYTRIKQANKQMQSKETRTQYRGQVGLITNEPNQSRLR